MNESLMQVVWIGPADYVLEIIVTPSNLLFNDETSVLFDGNVAMVGVTYGNSVETF